MQIEFSPRGLLSTFFRQRIKMMLVFLLIVSAGLFYMVQAKPQYLASGTLLIRFGEGATLDLNRATNHAAELNQNDRREMMQSNAEILQSHDLLQEVVQQIGPESIYPGISKQVAGKDTPLQAAVAKLQRSDLGVRFGMQSNLVDVDVTNRDPRIAERVVKGLFEHFVSRQGAMFNQTQTEFLDEQATQAQSRLEASQSALQDFKTLHGISDIEHELQQLMKDKGDASTLVFESLGESQDRLAELQTREAELLATYNPNSPAVKQLRKSIALAKRQINARQGDLKARAQARSGVLSERVGGIDRRISDLEAKRSQFNDLQRQVQIDEESYKNFKLRSEDARVKDTLNERMITRVSVVNEPLAGMMPVRPRKKLILAACLLAGFLLSIGTAAFFETMDQRFSTPEQVKQVLRTPLLASFAPVEGKR